MQSQSEGSGQDDIISKKVVLLGGTTVGKTSIFGRVINDRYSDNGIATFSAYHRAKILKVDGYDELLKINLWDTAG